ncbi:MAG: DUF4040 domain-containing protein [Cyanobacteria bacterium P01_A01_bin.123]
MLETLTAENLYILVITALLPLTACLLVLQVNPYQALVIRGILGAIAALVYALFGAADVALTEALVGTMLSITLYAVAVRSSMSLRLGILVSEAQAIANDDLPTPVPAAVALLPSLRKMLSNYHMRLEQIPYPSPQALQAALVAKDIHATCVLVSQNATEEAHAVVHHTTSSDRAAYHIQTRVRRLYEIMQSALPSTVDVDLIDVNILNSAPSEAFPPALGSPNSFGRQSS